MAKSNGLESDFLKPSEFGGAIYFRTELFRNLRQVQQRGLGGLGFCDGAGRLLLASNHCECFEFLDVNVVWLIPTSLQNASKRYATGYCRAQFWYPSTLEPVRSGNWNSDADSSATRFWWVQHVIYIYI